MRERINGWIAPLVATVALAIAGWALCKVVSQGEVAAAEQATRKAIEVDVQEIKQDVKKLLDLHTKP